MSTGGNPQDPFAEGPGPNQEPQRTIIRPTPGRAAPSAGPPGGGTAAPAAQSPLQRHVQSAAMAGLPAAADPADLERGSSNPLIAAAMPLLGFVARLRNVASGVNLNAIRERVYEELRTFAAAGRNAGLAQEPLRAGHYALCATVDDVIMNTPWGAHGGWSKRTMVSAFHGDVEGGERFFGHLDQMLQAPAANRPVLELMYASLSLGFEGRYRLHPRGPAEHAKVRENLYNTLRGLQGATERELSPEWRGVNAPAQARRKGVPIWLTIVAAMLVAFLVFAGLLIALAARSDAVEGRFADLLPMRTIELPRVARPAPPRPAPPRPQPPPAPNRFRQLLAPEIAAGTVTVEEVGRNVRIAINFAEMFASGDASPRPQLAALLQRIGEELKTPEGAGAVTVTGHTDNLPIRSLRFPSNQVLSLERANNSARIITGVLGDPSRVTARGRADAEPLADNRTPEGRARNRRIEINLARPG
ncbi:MAG: type VI secretion system protein TssL, long form [Alphaproteobacteria bacterium]|nr:type VI secretion system protein TssL, long form [Alphaproteobacteria bacterium]